LSPNREEHGLTLSVRSEFGLNLRSLFAKPARNELNQGRHEACSVGTVEHEIFNKVHLLQNLKPNDTHNTSSACRCKVT
jgi:hypothetical protein